MKIKVTSIAIALILPVNVNAKIISVDWLNAGDNLITQDTISGLNWLDLTVTNNMSYNNVYSELISGTRFQGYRYATSDEVISLWAQFGIDLSPGIRVISTPIDPGVKTFTRFLGDTVGAESIGYTGSIGMVFTDFRDGIANSAGAFNFEGSSYLEGIGTRGTAFDLANNFTGSYLVAQSSVPVPASMWLFFSGLISIFGIARNNQ